jgi:hypothetical protein
MHDDAPTSQHHRLSTSKFGTQQTAQLDPPAAVGTAMGAAKQPAGDVDAHDESLYGPPILAHTDQTVN